MAKHRIIFEIEDGDGSATIQIGDCSPIKVVDYKTEFNRPAEAIDPGDMPPADPWVRLRRLDEGNFILSGKLKWGPDEAPTFVSDEELPGVVAQLEAQGLKVIVHPKPGRQDG